MKSRLQKRRKRVANCKNEKAPAGGAGAESTEPIGKSCGGTRPLIPIQPRSNVHAWPRYTCYAGHATLIVLHAKFPCMTERRFPPPWTVEETQPCFIVRDHNGQALAFVYCEDEPGRRTTAKMLTRDEARRIAANIAKLPSLLAADRPDANALVQRQP
jgi:hypothetical protein